ncbi:sigma factor-like helix-turn-helix DNA-binding protein [Streptomyces anandii]|uniref:Sigma factor-like helix-turn-helix DNA-binding protein n=2 Tax=Streptomyces anandii TaxID=285454 RepID=A0ABW6H636_9ACTN
MPANSSATGRSSTCASEGLTQAQTGERLGVSQMHVSRLLRGVSERRFLLCRAKHAPAGPRGRRHGGSKRHTAAGSARSGAGGRRPGPAEDAARSARGLTDRAPGAGMANRSHSGRRRKSIGPNPIGAVQFTVPTRGGAAR